MQSISSKWPKGIPYIIGNEAAERYSFYGMKAILIVFLVGLLQQSGMAELEANAKASFWVHLFVMATYATGIMGALLSDILWGKYRTIINLSLVYCVGHFILAFWETPQGFFWGCTLIAIGAGGIKPCVSAHVGDQFDATNSHLIERMYNWFYFSINVGAIIAYLSAERILSNPYLTEIGWNARVAFGLPGLLMLIALIVFYLGRQKYISVKPAGWSVYKKEIFSSKGASLVGRLLPFYIFLAIFWSLFDQTATSWVIQAQSDLMVKTVDLGFFQFEFLPSQIGFVNPLFVLLFIPLFTYIIYPRLGKIMPLTYFNKMSLGFSFAVLSFALVAWVQVQMDNGHSMSFLYQIAAFVLLTCAEILISITSLEFSYTQAPKVLKSFILSFWLLAVAFGNGFTALINGLIAETSLNKYIQNGEAEYFLFFTALMALGSIGFYIVNRNYKQTMILQEASDYEVE